MKKNATFLVVLAASSAVHAGEPADNALEEVLVTGSRISESLDEVTASITIINPEQLADQVKLNPEVSQILSVYVPGMAPSTGTTSNFGQNLRGRSVLVLVDGVPQSTPLRNGKLGVRTIDASAIERIEVVKGATSIYGNGGAGGVVNYITKKANTDEALSAEVGLSTGFSGVSVKDSLSVRSQLTLDGTVSNFDYLLHTINEDNGAQRDADGDVRGLQYGLTDVESRSTLLKLGYQLNDISRIDFSGSYYEGQQDTDYVNVLNSRNSGEKSYAEKRDGERLPGDPQGPRGNHNIVLRYSNDEIFSHTMMAIDAYSQKIDNVFFYSTRLADYEAGFDGGQSKIVSEKQGVRANFNSAFTLGEQLDASLTYGVDYLEDTTKQDLVDGRIWVPKMEMSSTAPYLQGKLVIADDWVIKAGLRKEDIDIAIADYSTMVQCSAVDACTTSFDVKGGELMYDATTYNAGLRYNAWELFQPFVSYSEGFDVSDLGRLLRAATVTDVAEIHTEASVIENREIGFSGGNDALNYEFSYYQSKSDLGTFNSFNTVTGFYEPVRAPVKIWGWEAGISYQLSEALAVGVTHSVTEGKNEDSGDHLDGRDITPAKSTAYVNWAATEDLAVNASVLHVGNRDRFEANPDGNYVGAEAPVSSYTLVNIQTSYQVGALELFASIDNLLNEDYYTASAAAYTFSGYNSKGRGRWISLGANYSF